MPQHRTDSEHRDFAKSLRTAMTDAEDSVWDMVRAGRLNGLKFKRQVPFGPYVADFWCAAAALIVEIDGRTHDDSLRVLKDQDRDQYFANKGIKVLRLPDDLVRGSPEWAFERIKEAVASRPPLPALLRNAVPLPPGERDRGPPCRN